MCSFGQRKGMVKYLDTDTLKGLDTVYVELPELTGYYSLSVVMYFEELGGTSDGYGILEAANDTAWIILNDIEPVIKGIPNDTITITAPAKQLYLLYGTPLNKYRIALFGTIGDTTEIITNYILK